MRILYLLLYLPLKYVLRIFYPRIKTINTPKEFFGRTIYVSNHAASFMDPLVIGGLRQPIIFFMTRSDVFTKFSKPFLWAVHSLPIYRQHDGVDTKDENQKVFKECSRILKSGRNLLVFGEGFTDDEFVRRLKPVKKGAVRIGFIALETMQWKKKVYMAAVGCNYSDPNQMRSDLLISTSKKICLNDYKEEYHNNPNKTILEITKEIEKMMQEQITHIKDRQWTHFHENVMKLTRKGMNAIHSNKKLGLVSRWHYSQKLANFLNEKTEEELEELKDLKTELERYFSLLKKLRLNEEYVYEVSKNQKLTRSKELFNLIALLPFAILGMLHCAIPYILIKRFVEKSFRRKVFWGSVKLIFGMFIIGLINIPFIFLFYNFIYPSYWLAVIYYILIGFFGLSAYIWWQNLIRFQEKGIIAKQDISKIVAKRKELLDEINRTIPVA